MKGISIVHCNKNDNCKNAIQAGEEQKINLSPVVGAPDIVNIGNHTCTQLQQAGTR
jgi:hypothetical protein